MSKEKISAQEIIDNLALTDGVTKRVAEDFFKALINSIEGALLRNETVKIKGFGTFKPQWVAPRKSVNVQTGEDILLSGYYKVNFSPDNELKSLVNKPFEHLEAVVIDGQPKVEKKTAVAEDVNPLNSLTEQAAEIKDLLSEIQSMASEVIGTEDTGITEEIVVETTEYVIDEKVVEETVVNQPAAEAKQEEVIIKEPVAEKKYEEPQVKSNVSDKQLIPAPVKKKKTWIWVLLSVAAVILIALMLFFYNWNVNQWVHKHILKNATETVVVEVPRQTKDIIKELSESGKAREAAWNDIFEQRMQQPEYIATVKIKPGNRLAQLADKYYGSPFFWVYIYEANRAKLPNPDKLSEGMEIKIPKLDERLTDINNPLAVEKAKELSDQYLK